MPTAEEFLASTKWVQKVVQHFHILDANKNGFLTQGDCTVMVTNIKKYIELSAENEAKLLRLLVEQCARLGVPDPDTRLSQEEYVKAAANFASKEEENRPFVVEINQAWFDVLDTNEDGTISLEEYTKCIQASNFPPEAAKALFDSIDKNHNGKIEVKELISQHVNFWFGIEA